MPMTASLEDYLEAVYVLCQKNGEVRMTDISAFLGVTKPSANRAVSTLRDAGYLSHEAYGTITLTKAGEAVASKVLGRHRIIREFLVETLGVSGAVAEKDACRMEHVMSEETMEKLLRFLKDGKRRDG